MDENMEELQAELEVLVVSIEEMREYRNSDKVRSMGPAERTRLSQEQIAMEERAEAIRTYLCGDIEAEAAADEEAELEEEIAEEDSDIDLSHEGIEVIPEEDTLELGADDLEAADLTEEPV